MAVAGKRAKYKTSKPRKGFREFAAKMMDVEYEMAVTAQKKGLKEFKKRAKTQVQPLQIDAIPLTIEDVEDLSQSDRPSRLRLRGVYPSPLTTGSSEPIR